MNIEAPASGFHALPRPAFAGSVADAPGRGADRKAGIAGKALIFAWLVEGIAVVMGLVLAAFAGIEGSDSGTIGIVVALLPFAALSIVELTKIPLVALAFRVGWFWRCMALIALVFVTAATFENFVFGFERGFNERIRAVALAEQAVTDRQNVLALANAHLPGLILKSNELQAQLAALQKEVEGIRHQAEGDVASAQSDDDSADYHRRRGELAAELATLDARRDAAVAAERARCDTHGTYHCRRSAVAAGFLHQRQGIERQMAELDASRTQQRAAAEARKTDALSGRDMHLKAKEDERARLQAQLETVRTDLDAAQQEAIRGDATVMQAARERDERMEHSQLHRLSDLVFGDHGQANVERTKRFFVVSLAAIVAVIGSVIAAMYYASQMPANPARHRLLNSLRGYVARRRRRIPPVRDLAEALRQRHRFWRSLRALVARRRKRVVRIVRVPQDRLKLVYLPLTAGEAQVNAVREDALRDASGRNHGGPWSARAG